MDSPEVSHQKLDHQIIHTAHQTLCSRKLWRPGLFPPKSLFQKLSSIQPFKNLISTCYSGVPNSVEGLMGGPKFPKSNSMGGANSMGGLPGVKKISMGGIIVSWGSLHPTKNLTYNSPIIIIFKSYHPKIKCSLLLQSPSFYVNSKRFQHVLKSVVNSMGGPPGLKINSMGGGFLIVWGGVQKSYCEYALKTKIYIIL